MLMNKNKCIDRQTYRQTERDRQRGRDRQTDRQADRQTDRQTNRIIGGRGHGVMGDNLDVQCSVH